MKFYMTTVSGNTVLTKINMYNYPKELIKSVTEDENIAILVLKDKK